MSAVIGLGFLPNGVSGSVGGRSSSFSDLSRRSDQLDYVDVVQAACIISSQGSSGPFGGVDWETSHALLALGLKRSDADLYLEEASVLAG